MTIKKIFSIILIMLFLSTNYAYAENWVTITAENGKSADLDLDSVQLAIDTIEYDVRTRNNDFIYINRMSTELYKEGIPTAVIERTQYKGSVSSDNKVTNEKIKYRDYRELKAGTLQSEVFDVLSKELGKGTYNHGKSVWNKYLKRQRKQIYEHWIPEGSGWSYDSDIASPYYEQDVTLYVDKDGIIKNNNLEAYGFYDLKTIEPLPDDYTADVFKLNVKMSYFKYAGAKLNMERPVVKQLTPVHSEIVIAKNMHPPVIGHIQTAFMWVYKKSTYLMSMDHPDVNLFKIPFIIAGWCCGLAGVITSAILCLMSGVDFYDL